MKTDSPFPVDLVYLWVDGADPKWLAKKNAALAAVGKPIDRSAISGRFESKDELKYSLRSVQKCLPWINHIYIITDDQVPSWLNVDNPLISIIDHRDIVPAEFVPTFNSVTLELFIHHIPGLSEHFIYANDDMFVGAPLTPDFFFNASGDPIVILREKWYGESLFSSAPSRQHSLVRTTVMNTVRLMFGLTGKRYYMVISHAMEPMRKSYLEDIFAQHGSKMIADTATTFRETKNLQRIFYPLYNHAKGRTDLVADWRFGTERVQLAAEASRFRVLWHSFLRSLPFLRHDFMDVKKKGYGKIIRANPSLFCVNSSTQFVKYINNIEKLFPQKSEFEK